MRNGSSNASIDGHKGPTLDWRAANCSVDMVSPKTTRTDAIRRPIKAIRMADTRGVLSINMHEYLTNIVHRLKVIAHTAVQLYEVMCERMGI